MKTITCRNDITLSLCNVPKSCDLYLQVPGMAANDFNLTKHIEHLAGRCPEIRSILRYVYSDMRYPITGVGGQPILDYSAPCTAGEPDGCCLVRAAPDWNECFSFIDLEMREIGPGRLALYWPRWPDIPSLLAFGSQSRNACLLFHVLLRRHRCIEYVYIQESSISWFYYLVCDGLRLSHGLKHIRFCNYAFDAYPPGNLLLGLEATVAALDTLEMVSVRLSSVSARMLCHLLGRCEVLRELVFLDNWLEAAEAQALIDVLTSHQSLRKIHVDEQSMIGGCCQSLWCLVSGNANLEELIASRSNPTEPTSSPSFRPMFFALADPASHLKKLTISEFVLDARDLHQLSDALSTSDQLHSLKLLCAGSSEEAIFPLAAVIMRNKSLDICVSGALLSNSCYRDVTRATKGNITLEDLTSHEVFMTAEEAMPLLNALSANSTLQTLYLGRICQPGLSHFLKAIREKHLRDRLSFTPIYTTAADVISSLQGVYHKPASMTFEPTDSPTKPVLHRLSFVLCGNAFLVSLTVRFPHSIDSGMASLLSTVLASGKVLKQAWLDFPVKGSQAILLLQGIGKNRSLSDLTLCGWMLQPRVAVAFSNMLCSSRILNRIAFFETVTTWQMRAELPRGLASNYTLLALSGLQLRNHLLVHDCLRRNQSLLYQASRFVLPPLCNTKKAASAFEKVCWSDAFRVVIAQLAGLTEAEAAELVTRRRRYLDENFLVVAGVAHETVKCHSSSEVQIGQIGTDCWLEIRRHLCIDDILDSVEPPITLV